MEVSSNKSLLILKIKGYIGAYYVANIKRGFSILHPILINCNNMNVMLPELDPYSSRVRDILSSGPILGKSSFLKNGLLSLIFKPFKSTF